MNAPHVGAAAAMMFNHLRRPGQPFVTPEAVADFVEGDKVRLFYHLCTGCARFD